ncbi:hypothetical protein PR048_019614 [Dryococelus australis]|uniref:Uncharacterized protein n=1 Tax=Dryococelus australis TaxID=614101 RepID=A0ABQ9H4A9_9NEOP|nr:hypothetical protein PR048_019614 [Dryococelus australis]
MQIYSVPGKHHHNDGIKRRPPGAANTNMGHPRHFTERVFERFAELAPRHDSPRPVTLSLYRLSRNVREVASRVGALLTHWNSGSTEDHGGTKTVGFRFRTVTGATERKSGEILAALNKEVLRADEVWSSAGTKGWGKRKIPEKTRPPAASSGTIPTCEKPEQPGREIEPGSPWWEASRLTAEPPWPPEHKRGVPRTCRLPVRDRDGDTEQLRRHPPPISTQLLEKNCIRGRLRPVRHKSHFRSFTNEGAKLSYRDSRCEEVDVDELENRRFYGLSTFRTPGTDNCNIKGPAYLETFPTSWDILAALNKEVWRADGGEMRREWSTAGMQGRGKREIPEKTTRTAASSSLIPTCEVRQEFVSVIRYLFKIGDGVLARGNVALIAPALLGPKRGKTQQVGGNLQVKDVRDKAIHGGISLERGRRSTWGKRTSLKLTGIELTTTECGSAMLPHDLALCS